VTSVPLELKIESLRARGELSAEERDQLMQALSEHPPAPPAKRRWLTPLRLFLLGVVVGLAVAYLVWGHFS
jgi:hypothetical protein